MKLINLLWKIPTWIIELLVYVSIGLVFVDAFIYKLH